MPRWKTDVKDWFGGICVNAAEIRSAEAKGQSAPNPVMIGGVKMAKGIRPGQKHRLGIRTLQEGVAEYTRKKKNGNRLSSNNQIKASINKNQDKIPVATCKLAFTKINLANPADSPKIVVAVRKPQSPAPVKHEQHTLHTVRMLNGETR